jgi:CheY-like chemotaxis protein
LNYHLPGMNGIQLFDRLHAIQELAHVPAIMLSAVLPEQEVNQPTWLALPNPLT